MRAASPAREIGGDGRFQFSGVSQVGRVMSRTPPFPPLVWISLDSFVRIVSFQWVTADPNGNFSSSLHRFPVAQRKNRTTEQNQNSMSFPNPEEIVAGPWRASVLADAARRCGPIGGWGEVAKFGNVFTPPGLIEPCRPR
jgi:hypothetical protein